MKQLLARVRYLLMSRHTIEGLTCLCCNRPFHECPACGFKYLADTGIEGTCPACILEKLANLEPNMKHVIHMSHMVFHPDRDITEEELQAFLDSFIDLAEAKGYQTGGYMRLIEVEE